jgi:hypothetical protein
MSLNDSLSYLHEIHPGSQELSSQDAVLWPGYNPSTIERREKKGQDAPFWCSILEKFPRTLPSKCITK